MYFSLLIRVNYNSQHVKWIKKVKVVQRRESVLFWF